MSDIADQAARAEAAYMADTLARHRQSENRHSYSHCEDCGEVIPEARAKAVRGCRKCVYCQTAAEKQGAAYAHHY